MKRILIADASKSSLVMTSEVFKDHFPGVQVVVARNSADAIELAKTCGPVDAYVIDFDLPDKDGAQTAAKIKRFSPTPILITGYDRPEVQAMIERELAAYDDCLSWLRKPVKAELVVEVAKRFCEGKFRTQRRIPCSIPAILELNFKGKPSASKSLITNEGLDPQAGTKAEGSKNPRARNEATNAPLVGKLNVPVLLEDASIGGTRIRIAKHLLGKSFSKKQVAQLEAQLAMGEGATLHLPHFEELDGLKGIEKEWLSKFMANHSGDKKAVKGKGTKPESTLTSLQSTTQESLARKAVASNPALKSKVVWRSPGEEGELFIGLQSDSSGPSRKLFEAVLEMYTAQLKHQQRFAS
jgi:CheY-like chemotaxis protein